MSQLTPHIAFLPMKNSYLDGVFDVLDAHCHPCIMMGRFALGWMGADVWPEHVSPHIV